MLESLKSDGLDKLLDKLKGWGEGIIAMIPNMLIAIVVIFIFMALSRWVYNATRKLFQRTNFNKNLEHLMANGCRILVIIIGLILALAILQLQKTVFSLLAGVGVVGLALGFAFQDLAANFISGIMIAVRSPLKIDDVIEISGIQGTVIDIKLRDTLVRNFDGQDVFIPNKDFTSNHFTNYSSNGKRRVVVEVGVGYEDDAKKAVDVVVKALNGVENILSDPAPQAFISGLGGSSVNLVGYIWLRYPGESYLEVKSEAILKVKRALEAEGFNIPFPIRTINLDKGTKLALDKFDESKDSIP